MINNAPAQHYLNAARGEECQQCDYCETLRERQRELESESLAEGSTRFRRRIAEAARKGQGSTVGAASKLLQRAIDPLEVAIKHMIEGRKRPGQGGRGGRTHQAVGWCEAVGADVAAFMTAKVVLNGAKDSRRFRVKDAAREISQLILDELRFRKFQKEAAGYFAYSMETFTTSSYAHKARSLSARMKRAKVQQEDGTETIGIDPPVGMDPKQKIQVGVKLIDLFIEATDVVEIQSERTRNTKSNLPRNESFIAPTADTVKWLTRRNDLLDFLSPVMKPMVCPPLRWGPEQTEGRKERGERFGPWTPKDRGGYRYALRNKFPLAKASSGHQEIIARTVSPAVYAALNAIQSTAWKVNADVVRLVESIQRNGISMAGVAAYEREPFPPKPFDLDTNDDARKKYRTAKHAIHEANHRRKLKAIEQTKILSAARAVAQEAAIYFPYNLDFRGRVYPICDSLNPQGSDLSRALLTFANAKSVGSEGGKWLAIHGANCLGDTPEGEKINKLTLAERISWIECHSDDICHVADDPFTHKWWADADKPLQFYAFCVEWSRYAEMEFSERFLSGLPVYQDGSCNGLQHFSALLRDEVGAEAVNLLPMDRPQDIYQRVADRVLSKLEDRAASDWLAAKWLTSGLVTRKLTKRPTMTFGYGSKQFGFRKQVIDYLREQENWAEIKSRFTDASGKSRIGDASLLMAELIWDSVGDVAPSEKLGMEWMQRCARIIAKEGKPVSWKILLTNFPVRQEYFKETSKRVDTVLAGSVFQPRVYSATGEVSSQKQANSVAPNVIHSFDAAALMLTVERASHEGIDSFGVIHDSYATVAGDYAVLSRMTRQSFVRLYTSRQIQGLTNRKLARSKRVTPLPIESLYQQFREQMDNPEDCPKPPLLGKLDVAQVIASSYFFA